LFYSDFPKDFWLFGHFLMCLPLWLDLLAWLSWFWLYSHWASTYRKLFRYRSAPRERGCCHQMAMTIYWKGVHLWETIP